MHEKELIRNYYLGAYDSYLEDIFSLNGVVFKKEAKHLYLFITMYERTKGNIYDIITPCLAYIPQP